MALLSILRPVLLAAACVLARPALAAEILCYSSAFAPYVVQNGAQIQGIDVDMVAEAARRAELQIGFRLLPWVRLENEIRRGAESEVACAFAYTSNPQRQSYMDFMQVPLKITRYLLFVRKGEFNSASLEQLRGKHIGLRRGFVVPGVFEEMRRQQAFVVEEADDDTQNLQKLALRRVDAVVANADAGHGVLHRLQLDGLESLQPPLVESPTFLVFNKAKGMQALAGKLDRALLQMQQDGSAERIRARYLK